MNKRKFKMPLRYVLFILVFFCIGLMAASTVSPSFGNAIRGAGYTVISPMQKTLTSAGRYLSRTFSDIAEMGSIREENSELRARVEALEEENRVLYQNIYELQELRELYNLAQDYTHYDMTAATIIQRESGNWFSEFIINKGENDGIYVGANVLANGGLVGRVTYVGANYSRVISIINDVSNVGARSVQTDSYCVVRGDLDLYSEGRLRLEYIDAENTINDGDLIVTSNSSTIYFPGLAIGYAGGVDISSNNLTQSGYITPIADFSNMETVLVITTPNSLIDSFVEETSESGEGTEETTSPETESPAEGADGSAEGQGVG